MADAFLMGQSGKKLVGDALVSHVLAGKTFSNASSNKLTGTMPNRGKVNHQLSVNGTYTIPQGYHDGTGKIFQSVNTKGSQTFTPSTANQTIAAGQYLTGTQTILGDANLTAANIKSGVTIFGITGSAPIPGGTAGASQILAGYTFVNSQGVEVAGSIPSKTATTYTPGTAPQIIAAGQYLSGAQTIVGDADLVASNIKSGANIFGIAGSYTSDANATAGQILSGRIAYVNGTKITGSIPYCTNSSQAGAYLPSQVTSVPGDDIGVANHPSGANYLLVTTRPRFTGYVDDSTLIETFIPNLTKEKVQAGTVFGSSGGRMLTGTYTADATATAHEILSGKTGYVNGNKITGIMPNYSNTENQSVVAPYTWANRIYLRPPYGYYSGGDFSNVYYPAPNLIPENIKKGVNIFGVVGNYSPLAGYVWTLRTSSFGTTTINSSCYGQGTFVAVGDDGKLATSTDGTTWTLRTIDFDSYAMWWVCYGQGMFVVVGTLGKLATSTDGITWTQRTSSFGTTIIYSSCYGRGMYVVVGSSGKLATSTNGTSWTQRTSSFGTTEIWGVCYGQGTFVAVGADGKLATSTDGITWTQRTSSFGAGRIQTVCYGQGMFVAVGRNGKLATSTDGITWTQRTSSFSSTIIYSSCYGQGTFVATGGSGKLATSTDGITWTQRTSSFGTTTIYSSCYGRGMYVVVGSSGKLATSTNAIL